METENRIKVTVTMSPSVWEYLEQRSRESMVPRSRLVEKAIVEHYNLHSLDRRTQQPRDDARGEG